MENFFFCAVWVNLMTALKVNHRDSGAMSIDLVLVPLLAISSLLSALMYVDL